MSRPPRTSPSRVRVWTRRTRVDFGRRDERAVERTAEQTAIVQSKVIELASSPVASRRSSVQSRTTFLNVAALFRSRRKGAPSICTSAFRERELPVHEIRAAPRQHPSTTASPLPRPPPHRPRRRSAERDTVWIVSVSNFFHHLLRAPPKKTPAPSMRQRRRPPRSSYARSDSGRDATVSDQAIVSFNVTVSSYGPRPTSFERSR